MLCGQCIAYFAVGPDQDPRASPDWRGTYMAIPDWKAIWKFSGSCFGHWQSQELRKIHLDLGHVAVFRGLVRGAGIPAELETELFGVLQAKDIVRVEGICAGLKKHVDTRAQAGIVVVA